MRSYRFKVPFKVGLRVHHWFAGYGLIVQCRPTVKRAPPVVYVKWDKGGSGIAYSNDCQPCL